MSLLSTLLMCSSFARLERFLLDSGFCGVYRKRRIYCNVGSFTLSVVLCIPKGLLHRVRSSASSSMYSLLSSI